MWWCMVCLPALPSFYSINPQPRWNPVLPIPHLHTCVQLQVPGEKPNYTGSPYIKFMSKLAHNAVTPRNIETLPVTPRLFPVSLYWMSISYILSSFLKVLSVFSLILLLNGFSASYITDKIEGIQRELTQTSPPHLPISQHLHSHVLPSSPP
jgi:hypothetical protein